MLTDNIPPIVTMRFRLVIADHSVGERGEITLVYSGGAAIAGCQVSLLAPIIGTGAPRPARLPIDYFGTAGRQEEGLSNRRVPYQSEAAGDQQ